METKLCVIVVVFISSFLIFFLLLPLDFNFIRSFPLHLILLSFILSCMSCFFFSFPNVDGLCALYKYIYIYIHAATFSSFQCLSDSLFHPFKYLTKHLVVFFSFLCFVSPTLLSTSLLVKRTSTEPPRLKQRDQ